MGSYSLTHVLVTIRIKIPGCWVQTGVGKFRLLILVTAL